MREDDLEDAYATIDWAISQLPILEKEIKAWLDSPPYLVIEDNDLEMGQKRFKLDINRRLPPTIDAGAGAVINSIRTSLDLLAASLARRNGKSPNADRHFPIYSSIMDFIDPLSVAERKKWLSKSERSIIEGLKPYCGGHDLLFALHHLDIVRKHDRLLRVDLVPADASIDPEAYAQGMRFPAEWPRFKNGAVVATTAINATNTDFHISTAVTIDEANLIGRKPLVPALREFAGAADTIVQLFE